MSEPTPQAVEAAAKALRDKYAAEVTELPVESFLSDARAALTAAAPLLVAQAAADALEEAAEELALPGSSATGYYSGNDDAGYREAETHAETWLRERAAAIRDGAK